MSPQSASTSPGSRGRRDRREQERVRIGSLEGTRNLQINVLLSLTSTAFLALALAGVAYNLGLAVDTGRQIDAGNFISYVTPTEGPPDPTSPLYYFPTWAYFVFALISAVTYGLRYGRASRFSLTEEIWLRRRLLENALATGKSRGSDGRRTGDLVAMMTDGAERVALYRQTFLGPFIAALTGPLAVVFLMYQFIDHVVAAVVLAMLPIPPLVTTFFLWALRRPGIEVRRTRSALAAQFLDAIQGLVTLRLLRASKYMAKTLRAAGQAQRRSVMRMLAGNQVVVLLSDLVFNFCLVTVTAVVTYQRLQEGAIAVAGSICLVLWSMLLLDPIDSIGVNFYVALSGRAAAGRLREFLAAPVPPRAQLDFHPPLQPNQVGPSHATGAGEPGTAGGTVGGVVGRTLGGLSPVGTSGGESIEFCNVTYAHDPATPVLAEVNWRVEPGQRVVIVGASGAGKSSLIDLIKGDLTPSSGRVLLGGVDVTAQSAADQRRHSAVVAQNTWLFTGTVADNLRLANPQASEEELWAVLSKVHLAAEVRRMEAGINTQIGERGLAISGGQAQRLSLARALLAARPILLLDEPTSQVDSVSERIIVDLVARLRGSVTVIIVTHRHKALRGADHIYELAGGKLIERSMEHCPREFLGETQGMAGGEGA